MLSNNSISQPTATRINPWAILGAGLCHRSSQPRLSQVMGCRGAICATRGNTGGALLGGVGGVQLKNAKGVILTLQGPKAGVELSANVTKVVITLD